MCFRRWLASATVVAGAIALLGIGTAFGQEQPLLVTYGPQAAAAEGDPDYREVVYFRVPATTKGRLYLRIFDPDTGGEHDLIYGTAENTEVRFTLFGGAGAATVPSAPIEEVSEADLRAGEVLAERVIGSSSAFDDTWQTIASFNPDQGDQVDGRFVFRLLVEGISGNDANVYTPTLSLRDQRNLAPAGAEILAFTPTVRIPDYQRITELRFEVPSDAKSLAVRNFDAADGKVTFASTYRSLALTGSSQGEWQEDDVELLPEERGQSAAVEISEGEEMPNDVTITVADDAGRLLPIELPVRAWVPNQRPIPVADITPLAACNAVAFDASRSTDPDGDRLSYHWEFGDGATSDERAVVHTYAEPGRHRATLRVVDASGQVASGAAQPFEVVAKRPPIAEAGPDAVVAPGTPVLFDGTASQSGERPITRYLWDFQDGSTGEGSTVNHVFNAPGRHIVTLRVEDRGTGPCHAAMDQKIVWVNAPPVAVAGPDQHVSVGQVVTLDGRRSYDVDGEIRGYNWDLGDGTGQSGALIEHAFSEPGTYTVTLKVDDDSGVANSVAAGSMKVVVNRPPVAMAGSDRHVAIGEIVEFDGRGSSDADGSIVDHSWDFGDGGSGEGALVRYAYARSGTYRVTLTVRDDSGTDSSVSDDELTVVVNEPPVADAGSDQEVTSSEVRFDGTGSHDPDGELARYEWDFGDGSKGSGPRPVHVYQKPGNYSVRLTVFDDSDTVRNYASDITQVMVNAKPIADAGPDRVAAPGQQLTFSASGSIDPDGDLSAFVWDFDDGTTGSGERVEHRFDKPGVYRVRLLVQDNSGQAAAIDFDEAKVAVNAPPVAVAGPDVIAAPGDSVQFDASNSFDPEGKIATYRWDFSDQDEPQLGARVARSYANPGAYTARLTVIDDSGAINGTSQDEVAVRINHAPVASTTDNIFASSSTVTLDASQSADGDGDPLDYRWDFGDGSPPMSGVRVTHTYAEGGKYPVVLVVDDGTGLSNATDTTSTTVVIDRPPVADAGGNKAVCAGDVVVFDGTNSRDPEGGLLRYHWDFGDGTTSDIVNPTKVYEWGKVYPVTLTVEDESGFPGNRDTARIAVRVDESPIADAGVDQRVCAGSEVHFDGSGSRDSDGVVNRFSWDFGNGAVGGGETPTHVFREPGDHRVVLTITGDDIGQCDNTNSDEMIVTVVEAPIAHITAPAQAPVGASVAFDAGGSSGPGVEMGSWRWDFGDGTSAEGPVVEHVFSQAGAYLVTLSGEAKGEVSSCSAVTAQQSVVVNAPPVADAGEDRQVGVDQEVLFDASGSSDADGAIVAYDWDFGDGTTASGFNVRHRFRESGRYAVQLTVTDNTTLPNNRATSTATVTVNSAPTPAIASVGAACAGSEVAFSGAGSRDADGDIMSYAWNFGDRATAAGPEVAHTYEAPGFYDVSLEVDDGAGLNNSREQTTLRFHVNRPPSAQAGPDRMVCPGDNITFDGSASSDWDGELAGYSWDFDNGSSAEGRAVEHAFAEPGVYNVRLTVTDNSGSQCSSGSDTSRVIVDEPPIMATLDDREGFVGGAHDQILFDASALTADDGRLFSYHWDFGDGVSVVGEKVLHGYDKSGVYPVVLTVSDGSGLPCGQSTAEATVTIRKRE